MIYYFYYFRSLSCADVKQPIDRFLSCPIAVLTQTITDVDKIFGYTRPPFLSMGNFSKRLSLNFLSWRMTWFTSEIDPTDISPCCATAVPRQSVINGLHSFFSRTCQCVSKLQEAFHKGYFDMLYSTYWLYQVAMRCPVQSKHFSNWYTPCIVYHVAFLPWEVPQYGPCEVTVVDAVDLTLRITRCIRKFLG